MHTLQSLPSFSADCTLISDFSCKPEPAPGLKNSYDIAPVANVLFEDWDFPLPGSAEHHPLKTGANPGNCLDIYYLCRMQEKT